VPEWPRRVVAAGVAGCAASLRGDMDLNRRQFIEVASGAAVVLPLERQPAKSDKDDPLGVRRDFPAARDGLYLNSAYIAPVPTPAADAARVFAERKASKPIPLDEMLKKTDEVRGQFARLVGAEPDEIGFLYSTSGRREHRHVSARLEGRRQRRRGRTALQHVVRAVPASGGDAYCSFTQVVEM
jgi:hypothetical protein